MYPLGYPGLARTYGLEGKRTESRAAYERFFDCDTGVRMRFRRRIAVTVEKREISMLPVALAASLAGVPERFIYQWLEAGKVQFLERPNGVVPICPESLRETHRFVAAPSQSRFGKTSDSEPRL